MPNYFRYDLTTGTLDKMLSNNRLSLTFWIGRRVYGNLNWLLHFGRNKFGAQHLH
jgi:hypothetical protein